MPIPFIVWGLAALAAGAAAGKGGEVYSEHVDKKARQLRDETEREIKSKQRSFESKRRAYLERVISLAGAIHAALEGVTPSVANVPSALPKDLQELWTDIVAEITKLAPGSYEVLSLSEQQSIWHGMRAAVHLSRSYPNLGPITGFAAAGFYAYSGIGKAINAESYYAKVLAACEEARSEADASLGSLQTARDELDMRWDNTVAPLLPVALGPPRNVKICAQLSKMANMLVSQANEALRETST